VIGGRTDGHGCETASTKHRHNRYCHQHLGKRDKSSIGGLGHGAQTTKGNNCFPPGQNQRSKPNLKAVGGEKEEASKTSKGPIGLGKGRHPSHLLGKKRRIAERKCNKSAPHEGGGDLLVEP